MPVLIASNLGKDVAGAPLLRGLSFTLERGERLTVAGRNGTGKTTLLRMLAGEAQIDVGDLTLGRDVRCALHDQRPPRERDLTLGDYVFGGASELIAIESGLAQLEQEMGAGATDSGTLDRYAQLQARLEHAGGYAWRERVVATMRGLGFEPADGERSLRSFSGGELTRASLARVLASDPDLLLLDEPTNHLDIGALEWLEATLVGLDAAIVLVAHDRWFLEAVGTAVLELDDGRGRYFAGTWHSWRAERAARALAEERAAERRTKEIERLERFVARFGAGTRARQAQSRSKKLEKLGPAPRADLRRGGDATLRIALKAPERSGRVVFELEAARIEAGERVLLERADLWLERGEHVSLVGPNGAGKTTLLETLTGRREPAGGKLRRGHNVKLGYLSQHAEELGGRGTVLEAAQRATGLTPNRARALLGRFLFGGDAADKPLADLSGGERQRLSLAVLVAGGANVLVLDEPTNHLDLESREALEDALRAFGGALLLVSHDRALLDAVGSRVVAIENGTLRSYLGGWPEYLAARETARAPEQSTDPHRESRGKAQRRERAGARAGQREQDRAERAVARAEERLAELERELSDPAAWATEGKAAAAAERHERARRAVEQAYADLGRLEQAG